jgi:hypothetical protein
MLFLYRPGVPWAASPSPHTLDGSPVNARQLHDYYLRTRRVPAYVPAPGPQPDRSPDRSTDISVLDAEFAAAKAQVLGAESVPR